MPYAGDTMAPRTTLTDLPDEIIFSIVSLLEVPSLLALNLTAKRFISIVDEPSLWRRFCQNDFRYWNDRKEFRQQLVNPQTHEWRAIYQQRTRDFRIVGTTLNDIIDRSMNRCDKIQAIVGLGYQAKDALIRAFHRAHYSKNHLAQRYWSHVALGCLHRTIALKEWSRLRYRSDIENPTERSLAALDLFVLGERRGGDIDDIFDKLDEVAESVRRACPEIDEQTTRQKAICIASYLREHKWIGMEDTREFHCLDHIFLGVALSDDSHASLPLISCVIYSYVCRRFGLRAQPCNYPQHVHAVVEPPEGFDVDGNVIDVPSNTLSPDVSRLFMDPFNTEEPIPLSILETRLRVLGARLGDTQLQSLLNPVSARAMLERTALNLLHHSPSRATPPISGIAATYAAYFALCSFPTTPHSLQEYLINLTQTFLHHFDQDIRLFREYILPLTQTLPNYLAYRDLVSQLLQADMEQASPKLRPTLESAYPNAAKPLRYRVGQVFRHRRQRYLACIYGWDPTCTMPVQWISMNRVDDLPRGRHQPFYNAYVADDESTRYVAEENVQIIGRTEDGGTGTLLTADEADGFGIEIGKWFKRYDVETGKFVSNVRHEYPED